MQEHRHFLGAPCSYIPRNKHHTQTTLAHQIESSSRVAHTEQQQQLRRHTTTRSSVSGSSPFAPRCVSRGTVGVGVDVGFGAHDFRPTKLLVVSVGGVAIVALWQCYVCGKQKRGTFWPARSSKKRTKLVVGSKS